MTHRERVLAALRHEVPDRIPIDAICIENATAVGQRLQVPPESVNDCLGIDGRIVAAGKYTGPLAVRDGKTLSHWGTEDRQDYGTTHVYPLAAATSVAQVDGYSWPDGSLFRSIGPRHRPLFRTPTRGMT